MYTLRLILEGVLFLAFAQHSPQEITILLLNPEFVNSNKHVARLKVHPDMVCTAIGTGCEKPSTRPPIKDMPGLYELAGSHVDLEATTAATDLVLVTGTKKAGQAKPCYGCNATFTVAQQSADIGWLNDMSDIANVAGIATPTFRKELFDFGPPPFVLGRVTIDKGEVRTGSVWGPDPSKAVLYPDAIDLYCYTSASKCGALDEVKAVGKTVVIDIPIRNGSAFFHFTDLADGDVPADDALYLKDPGADGVIEVKLFSHPTGTGKDGDFKVFYELLDQKPTAAQMVFPRQRSAGDVGGACSPIRP